MKARFKSSLSIMSVGLLLILSIPFFMEMTSVPVWSQENIPSSETIKQKLIPPSKGTIKTRGLGPIPRPGGTVDLQIPFDLNQYSICQRAVPYLQELGTALSSPELNKFKFTLEGHTCNLGSDSYNKWISQKRAETVRNYLVGHFNICRDQLEPIGYGKEKPIANNDTEEGRNQNRRVTIVNTQEQFECNPPTPQKPQVDLHMRYRRGTTEEEIREGAVLTARDDYYITFTADRACYVYIYQIDGTGKLEQLFPNKTFTERVNPVMPANIYRIPDQVKGSLYLDETKGDEEIMVIAVPGNQPEENMKIYAMGLHKGDSEIAGETSEDTPKQMAKAGAKTRGLAGPRIREETPPPPPLPSETTTVKRIKFSHQ